MSDNLRVILWTVILVLLLTRIKEWFNTPIQVSLSMFILTILAVYK